MAIVQANTSFHAGSRFVQKGSLFNDTDKLVKRYPGLFDAPKVESATANPGERRAVSPPKKKGKK